MIGVGSTTPVPSPATRAGAVASGVATAASSATLWWAKTSRTEIASPAARARLTRRIEAMESPPTAKKPSSMPTLSRWSTSAKTSQSSCSLGERAALPAPEEISGGGSALRSSLPLGVRGRASSITKAAGTM